jgi:6,7-dimethyl-8-ribityllumazine synthase
MANPGSTAPLPRRPRLVGPRKTFAIVASLYNEPYVQGLLQALKNELLGIMPSASVPLYHVPGTWEIPATAEFVLQNTSADIVIAVGVVIQGETSHANVIVQEVSRELMAMSTRHTCPIINCIIDAQTEEQASVRCLGAEHNRGVEAARAALNMAELFHKLHVAYPGKKASDVE